MSTRQARTADKSTNDKHTRILKALLQKPGNKFCVDCRKKVKSVDLDSWTVEQVENMIKWGNEKANMYWEARLPERNIPNESTSGIDPWIRSKYEHKQFAQKGGLPDPSELGPIDEAMLMDLYGKAEPDTRVRAHMNRSSESSGGFNGMIAPPPANPTRSSFPKRPTSSGVQGADLFSIGQRTTPAKASPTPVQEDFFGLNDPVPAPAPAQKAANPAPSSAAQDLFSMTTSVSTPVAPAGNAAAVAPAKAGSSDWKTNIMSLYGSQSSSPKPNSNNSNGFGQSAGFGQLQGMDAFGFGQAPAQQQQQQQQVHNPWGNDDGFGAMQQASATSNSSFDAFGTNSNQNNGFGGNNNNSNNGFGGFSNQNNGFGGANNNSNNNNGGFGAFHNGGFGGAQNNNNNGGFGGANNNNNNSSMPQGGDLFNLLAGAARSPTATTQNNNNSNKNSGAFGDLSWN
ncbi:hypothetical protein BGZ96_000622 [Linnemannia gamsii]|uniref:Arf-GAP domain-containing protein n=1 Tax=Linnemannia gamsii TaxID=64522 RepID=A0ABQ7KCD7_9FUNG|nr:hypothetical protein BGZ96_000622 [Linnemannia gamsii]